jgi:hypothetical protein
MKLTAALSVLVLSLSLTACAGAEASAPSGAPASVCQEDDPCWDDSQCYDIGNYICGPSSEEERALGWQEWDSQNGGRFLKVDPSRPYKVMFNGTATRSPKLEDSSAALVGRDGRWYVFTAAYTD